MNNEIRIYSNDLDYLDIDKITIEYVLKDSSSTRKFVVNNFMIEEDSNVHFAEITNKNYLNAIEANMCESVTVHIDKRIIKDYVINIIDNNSLLSIYNVISKTGTIKLKNFIQLHIKTISEYETVNVLSNIESVHFYDEAKNELFFDTITSDVINGSYVLSMDLGYSMNIDYFKFKFMDVSPYLIDSLFVFDVYKLGKLVSSENTYRHITNNHHFAAKEYDDVLLTFDYVDAQYSVNINEQIESEDIDFIRVFYTDNSNLDCSVHLNGEHCQYIKVKHGDIESLEVYWKKPEPYLDRNIMIVVSQKDTIKTKYSTILPIFNFDKINRITSITQVEKISDKVSVLSEWLRGSSTILTVTSSIKNDITIYDIDMNHIFTTYNFNYFTSYQDNNNVYYVYICPHIINLEDSNFIGMKYYFSDISNSYNIGINIISADSERNMNDILLSGRSFNCVIPTDYESSNDSSVNKVAHNSTGLYKDIKDLPSEYVKYGSYNIDDVVTKPDYIDIDLSLTQSSDNDFTLLYNNDAIAQSLYNLFLSVTNDRPLKPWLEANLRNRLFDIEGDLLNHIMRTYIDSYVTQVEPRVTIHSLETSVPTSSNHNLIVVIVFSINETSTTLPFSFNIGVEK